MAEPLTWSQRRRLENALANEVDGALVSVMCGDLRAALALIPDEEELDALTCSECGVCLPVAPDATS